MTRRDFTKALGLLINKMYDNGHEPIVNHVFRSREEQKMLYDKGYSKCDGTIRISKHQLGKAVDIYFYNDGSVDWGYEHTKDLAILYHDYWVSLGGDKVIEWDLGHYQFS